MNEKLISQTFTHCELTFNKFNKSERSHRSYSHNSNEHIRLVPHHMILNNVIGFNLINFVSLNSPGKHLLLT